MPISSTAHLALVPYFFHWKDPGLSFDLALHFGTLIALVLFFWKDWLEIAKLTLSGLKIINYESTSYLKNRYILWLIAIATIPGAIFGFLLENKAETVFRNPLLIALTLSIVGLILFLADKYAKRRKDMNQITILDSILIGISQAVAIIPGVSRSGATITTGLMRGLNRVDAARFSFLLSAPIILGACIVKVPKLFSSGVDMSIVAGMVFSALSGYLAIKYLLKLVEKYSYRFFFWYRLGLAILIVLVYILK